MLFVAAAAWIRQGDQLGRAPYFRRRFACGRPAARARAMIAVAGYYEFYLNGRKVGNHVLDPVVTHYDRRVRYVAYDVTERLHEGENVAGVILGNGWYNCQVENAWSFEKASWRDGPKFLLQIQDGDNLLLVSDTGWKCAPGPILFDELRQGETYDARQELTGWLEPGYDDRAWQPAVRIAPPGGLLQEQTMPPCQVMQTLAPVKRTPVGGGEVVDFGQNISGWCRIRVHGDPGAKVTIRYGERLHADGSLNQEHLAKHHTVSVEKGEFQTDRYFLKGGAVECWEPRFVYHGFQYAQVVIEGKATLEAIDARFVYTAFEQIGRLSCSDETLNHLQECTVRSYPSNFVGIPTDCPHREKNGWTGDAQLAVETGLFNFAAGSAYTQWMDSFADVQRPSGQLPAIVPSSGWGFNWGNGPAWDSAFLIIPWNVYLYTGDKTAIVTHYEAMKCYVDYCTAMADGDIVSFGLGDWCPVDWNRMIEPALTSTGYYFADCRLLATFAHLLGKTGDACHYADLADRIRDAFNRRFYRGHGLYAKGEQTALACALYHGLAEASEHPLIIQQLVKAVTDNACKADFGILGAKYVPRVLADNGYAELACELIMQPEYPGWGYWIRQGATSLWEDWRGENSLNHIMFGDLSAWMYQYLAGITPDSEHPGFAHFTLRPRIVRQVDWVRAEHRSPHGVIRSAWKRDADGIAYECEIPPSASADIILGERHIPAQTGGNYQFRF